MSQTNRTGAARRRRRRPTEEYFAEDATVWERFHWRWVLFGVAFIVVGNALAYLAIADIVEDLIQREGRLLAGVGLLGGVALAIYFVGGLLIGRLSADRTLTEPAVAAVVAVVVLFVLQLLAGMVNVLGLLLGAPLCFGVAYLGGFLGEKWQEAVRR